MTIFKGQLWQPCTERDCSTEPVCANCERCDRHCRCDILPVAIPVYYGVRPDGAQTTSPPAVQAASDPDFRSRLPAGFVLCEGERLRRVTLGEVLHTETRNGFRTTFHTGVTPGGLNVVVAFGYNVTAHGEEAALDDLVRPDNPLTPQGALALLVQLSELRLGAVHTGNRDAARIVRLSGGAEQVAAVARTGTLYLPYDRIDNRTPSHSPAVLDAILRHDLQVTSVQFEQYLYRAGRPTRHLYRGHDGRRYSSDSQRADWHEETA